MSTNETLRFLSVCSGIEAASVAWSPLGWKASAFSEIEAFPCAVLAHHYPTTPNHGDMTAYADWPDHAIDLLCGGTPCQSFSVAGLRKGLDDPRGNLMLTFGAIAARYRPRWLVWENVPGVLSSKSGRDFGSFLGMLGRLGYGFAYRVLDAQHFGLAQRRKRVFVVGCLGDWRSAAAVLFERHSVSGHPAPRRQAREDVARTLTRGSGGGQRYDAESETLITHSLRGEGFDASEDGTGRGTPLVLVARSVAIRGRDGTPQVELGDEVANALLTPNGGRGGIGVGAVLAFDHTQVTSVANRSNPQPSDPCHPITAEGYAPTIAFDARQSDVIQYGEKSGPLDADGHTIAVHHGPRVRRLTPRECERLQGFPDDYTLISHRGKLAADGPRYKALGNSWAVPNVRWIGRRIAMVDAITRRQDAA